MASKKLMPLLAEKSVMLAIMSSKPTASEGNGTSGTNF